MQNIHIHSFAKRLLQNLFLLVIGNLHRLQKRKQLRRMINDFEKFLGLFLFGFHCIVVTGH